VAKFLVTFHRGDMVQDPESVSHARHALVEWAAMTGPALVDAGAPVRSTATLTRDGIHDEDAVSPFLGWSVIDASDRDAAVLLLQDHPLLRLGALLQISEPV
jgi:hypothetical protein